MAENNVKERIHPKLKEQFISNIKGKDFVLYSGLLDLAHQIGIKSIQINPIQYPQKENGMEAICKATVESTDGQVFTEIGDANPRNVNRMIAEHLLRMAATRAKARAFRDMTNIGMTCLEELGDLNQIAGGNNGTARPKSKTTVTRKNTPTKNKKENKLDENSQKSKATTENQKTNSKTEKAKEKQRNSNQSRPEANRKEAQASTAQVAAITNLGKRRGIPEDELETMAQEAFKSSLNKLTSNDASAFIRQLQQAA